MPHALGRRNARDSSCVVARTTESEKVHGLKVETTQLAVTWGMNDKVVHPRGPGDQQEGSTEQSHGVGNLTTLIPCDGSQAQGPLTPFTWSCRNRKSTNRKQASGCWGWKWGPG